MKCLKTVEVWPSTGFDGASWCDDVDADAFAKTAVAVCARFSEGLTAAQLPHRTTFMRIATGLLEVGARDEARFQPSWLEPVVGNWEYAELSPPQGFASWCLEDRQRFALDAVCFMVSGVCERDGLPNASVEVARQWVMEHAFGYAWTGAAKSSPDRQHKAVLAFEIDAVGRTWVQVRCASRSGEELASDWCRTRSELPDIRRTSKTLTWTAPDQLTFTTAYGSQVVQLSAPSLEGIVQQPHPHLLVHERTAADASGVTAPRWRFAKPEEREPPWLNAHCAFTVPRYSSQAELSDSDLLEQDPTTDRISDVVHDTIDRLRESVDASPLAAADVDEVYVSVVFASHVEEAVRVGPRQNRSRCVYVDLVLPDADVRTMSDAVLAAEVEGRLKDAFRIMGERWRIDVTSMT